MQYTPNIIDYCDEYYPVMLRKEHGLAMEPKGAIVIQMSNTTRHVRVCKANGIPITLQLCQSRIIIPSEV